MKIKKELTLDRLPFGNDTAESVIGRYHIEVPEGVTRSMLRKDVMLIALPSLVELVLSQLTGMADQIMVGRMAGNAGVIGLGAVGMASSPKFMLMMMIQSMNVGATAVIARFRGQQNRSRANAVFKQSLLITFFISILMMFVGLAFGRRIIIFMSGTGVSEATLQAAENYLRIQMIGFVPLCLTFTVTAALRGVGDSRTPMIYNTAANIINVIFNYLLIYGHFGLPEMGVEGASWATLIGQTAAAIIAFSIVLSKRGYIILDLRKRLDYDGESMADIINIGLPSMIEQLFMRAGMIIFTHTVTGLGDIMFATHQICMNLLVMTYVLGQAISNASTTLLGQSLGKRRYDIAVMYMREAVIAGTILSTLVGLLIAFFCSPLIALYNKTPEVILAGAPILVMVGISQPLQSAQFIITGGLRGAGDTRFTAVVTAITVFGFRSFMAVLFVNIMHWGLTGAWAAIVSDQIIRTAMVIWRYRSGKWARMALDHVTRQEKTRDVLLAEEA